MKRRPLVLLDGHGRMLPESSVAERFRRERLRTPEYQQTVRKRREATKQARKARRGH